VSFVVLDTDVASAVLRGRVPDPLARRLTGQSLAVTFVTVGELTRWTLVRRWGPQRLAGLRTFFSRVVVLPTARE
jgi:toxin FitB